MTNKQRDKAIEQAYCRHCAGTSINIMDIPKLFADARLLIGAGMQIDDAVISTIAVYGRKV